ncbi:MAG: helix-turn-helix transcriptional regulator [Clostridia bacterium]|nr:helix-turn-helix transcriptional regulator [Clostridia bacterium]
MSKFDIETIGNNLLKAEGHFEFHLLDILHSKNITKYALSKITNIRYDTICNYCSGKVTLINTEYLRIFCYVLDCEISDIIKYIPD